MDVDASYQIGYPGLHKNGLITLNPNAYNSHLGVAQLTLGHELIHYRDWLGRALLIKSVLRVKLPLSHLGLTHHFAHGHAKAG